MHSRILSLFIDDFIEPAPLGYVCVDCTGSRCQIRTCVLPSTSLRKHAVGCRIKFHSADEYILGTGLNCLTVRWLYSWSVLKKEIQSALRCYLQCALVAFGYSWRFVYMWTKLGLCCLCDRGYYTDAAAVCSLGQQLIPPSVSRLSWCCSCDNVKTLSGEPPVSVMSLFPLCTSSQVNCIWRR